MAEFGDFQTRNSRQRRKSLQPDSGAGEPMLLVISLIVAMSLMFLIYGDRMRLDVKTERATQVIRSSPLPLLAFAGPQFDLADRPGRQTISNPWFAPTDASTKSTEERSSIARRASTAVSRRRHQQSPLTPSLDLRQRQETRGSR